MEIYISKITFEDAGNSGGGGITTPCYITEELQGYSEKEMGMLMQPYVNDINYTNALTEEWDASNTSAKNIYSGNTQMVYAPAIDTQNVTDMYGMFRDCSNLVYVPNYNTSKLKDMSYMFYGCSGLTSLDLSGWDTVKVTKMANMFANCTKLSSLDLSGWDTSNVTNINSIFYYCYDLTSLDLSGWNTSKVTEISSAFSSCIDLISLDLSGWNLSNVTKSYYAVNVFASSTKLRDLILNNTILPNLDNASYWFDKCTALTVESLVGLLNALPVAGGAYTFTLGTTNLNKLSDEQKAIAINKGWTLI